MKFSFIIPVVDSYLFSFFLVLTLTLPFNLLEQEVIVFLFWLQFAWIIIFQFPFLRLLMTIALFHHNFVLWFQNCKTLLGRAMPYLICVHVICPKLKINTLNAGTRELLEKFNYLIALRSVAWIKHNIVARVIQACFVSSNLASFTEHPVLLKRITNNE